MKVMQFKNITYSLVTCMLFGLYLLSVCNVVNGQDLIVSARLDRAKVGLNENFDFIVELSGNDAQNANQPELQGFDEFARFAGSNSSQSIQIVNGAMNVSRIFTYRFIASKIGKFKIAPVTVRVQGKVITSKGQNIEITKNSPDPATANGANPGDTNSESIADNLFLRAETNHKTVFQNEPLIVDYKIYTRVQVTNYGFSNQPNYGSFWVEEFKGEQQPRLYDTTVNGLQYKAATLRKVALFPTSSGTKTIPVQELEASVRLRERRGRRDLFDSFFDDPFFGRNKTHRLKNDPISIKVLPLPKKGKPDNFTGAVGKFSIQASVDKKSLKANEALTYKVVLSGAGNIKTLQLPEIDFSQQFQVYDPEIKENINRAGQAITGSKTYEYVLIPRRDGLLTLPSLHFSYFDPAAKIYKKVRTKNIVLDVKPGDQAAVQAGSGFLKEEVELFGDDIRYIEKEAGTFSNRGARFYHKSIFWLFLFVPLFIWAAGYFYRSFQDRLTTNVAYARSRKAQKSAQKQLKSAKAAMDAGDVALFYTEAANALTKLIGNKLNLDEAALVSDEVIDILGQRGVDSAIVDSYRKLLSESDFYRFAHSDASGARMSATFEQVQKLIVEIDRAL